VDLEAYLKTLDKKGLDRDRALLMFKMFTGKKAKEVLG
jgi:hypothetical protein